MTAAKCGDCAFWDGPVKPDDLEVGACRRYPAVLVPPLLGPDPHELEDRNLASEWPVTYEHEWCGEFRPYGAFAWQPERPEPATETTSENQ